MSANLKLLASALIYLISSAAATGPIPVSRTGLAGIDGFTFYNPYCGHGCFRSFSPYMLECSTAISPGGHTTADAAAQDLALCRASDFPYLSSIAWCISIFCPKDVLPSTIEHFWETQITGDASVLPKWSYGETLAKVTQPPTEVAMGDDLVLNRTMLTTYHTWKITQDTLIYFFGETKRESYFGYAIHPTHSVLSSRWAKSIQLLAAIYHCAADFVVQQSIYLAYSVRSAAGTYVARISALHDPHLRKNQTLVV